MIVEIVFIVFTASVDWFGWFVVPR